MTKGQILALTIAELELPREAARGATAAGWKDFDRTWWGSLSTRKQREARLEAQRRVTVADVFSSCRYANFSWEHSRSYTDDFLDKLAKLGLTRFDNLYLPQSTLTLKVMRSISKEEWLEKPAFLLGTLSTPALKALGKYEPNGVTGLTVRELLAFGEESPWKLRSCSRSVAKTRKLLGKLGFAYEDGPFMQFNTLRAQTERIAATYGVSDRMAKKFVQIARAEGRLLGDFE